MSTLTSLPCEVIISILQNLDNVQSLVPALLSCRHVYSSFNESPQMIRLQILQRQISPALLPYSMAIVKASCQLSEPDEASIKDLLDTLYDEPSRLLSQLQTLPAGLVSRMGRMHDLVESFVNDFAVDAWDSLTRDNPCLPPDAMGRLSLWPTEHSRFCCAFYRFELFVTLARSNKAKFSTYPYRRHFSSRLASWEIEQILCVHNFLEKRFLQASVDIIDFDVEYGDYSIESLRLASRKYPLQGWLSQGLEFINQVVGEGSFEKKKTLLETALPPGVILIYRLILLAIIETTLLDGTRALEEYTEDEIEENTPRHALRKYDVDTGPRVVWCTIHKEEQYIDVDELLSTACLREQGYILWDLSRIQVYNMFPIFEMTLEMARE
ncbi:hypothetical protein F4804DRAFT_297123 [Jackrogersella minutella]|nr:hypothetical protein F4804DRAFT_297123 [Jackrogersella minutella]